MPPHTSTSFIEATPPRPTAALQEGLALSTPPRGRMPHSGHASSEEASPFCGRLATLACTPPPFPHAPPFPHVQPIPQVNGGDGTGHGSAAKAAADFCWARGTPPMWHGSNASASSWGVGYRLGPDVDVETPEKLKAKHRTAVLDAEEVKMKLNLSTELFKRNMLGSSKRKDAGDPSSAGMRAEAAEFVPQAAATYVDTEIMEAQASVIRSPELAAAEAKKALAAFPSIPPPLPKSLTTALSCLAEVDDSTLVIPSRLLSGMIATAAENIEVEHVEAPDNGALAAAIDDLFEPFALQHNSRLLLAIARQLGKMTEGCAAAAGAHWEGWPWTVQALAHVAFSTEELLLCMQKSTQTRHPARPHLAQLQNLELSKLRHLSWVNGAWHLQSPPEIRCFLSAPDVARSLVVATTRAILGRSSPPAGVVTVLSYSVSQLFEEQVADFEVRWQRLMQQLCSCHTDILCLQGFQAKTEAGMSLAARLKADGFAYVAAASPQGATSCGQANAIFWDQRRWEAASEPQGHGHEGCAALLVELRLREEPTCAIRVASLQPQLMDCCNSALNVALNAPPSAPSTAAWVPSPSAVPALPTARPGGGALASKQPPTNAKTWAKQPPPPPPTNAKKQLPVLVCTDLSGVGGAASAVLVPGLLGLRSAMLEATGEEMASPSHVATMMDTDAQQTSRLRPLCRHDAVLVRDLKRLLVLSGHTEGYLTTMPDSELHKQFPAGRLPIIAAFSLAN